jgi:eukaryotic-like serine/threonine-protein kinase
MVDFSARASWEFDRFKLLPDQRLLVCDGTPVPLTSKAFDSLVFLVENRNRLVTKDELLRAVWPDVVVEEGNLTQQVFLLRKVFGDSAQHPRYIITVPGHGYRFTAPVKEILPGPDLAPDVVASESSAASSLSRTTLRFVKAGVVLSGIVALAVLLAISRRELDGRRPYLDPGSIHVAKVTESGKATNAAISPDGRTVAYAENNGDEYSLWVKQIATGGRTQIVAPQPSTLMSLTYGPDGQHLYFTRGTLNHGGFVLYRIPAMGGSETPVLDDVDTRVSFSPDGNQFVFMRGAGIETHIVIAKADGGSQRILASRRTPLAFSFFGPSWSPDGKSVVASVADRTKGVRWSIVHISVEDGSSREIFTTENRIGSVRWVPDGSGLLTVVSETLARQEPPWASGTGMHISGGAIWHIAYPSGRAERLTRDLADYDLCCLDIAAANLIIADVQNSLVSDLWITPADQLDKPRQITWGTPLLRSHSWLPDNDTIVYRDLNGHLNAVHRDGRAVSLPIPDKHKVVSGVSACGDGRNVVFQSTPGSSIWRMAPDGGGAVRLTNGYLDANPACSPDGKWVVYTSMRDSFPSIWQIPIEGGEPVPLIEKESFEALPSPSGRLLYYSGFEWEEHPVRIRRLRWVVISSGDRKRLFAFERPADATMGVAPVWAPDESGLDYVVTQAGVSNIWRQPLSGGPPVQITHFSAGKIFSFAWSPDGRWLSLGSGINRSDLVLISEGR